MNPSSTATIRQQLEQREREILAPQSAKSADTKGRLRVETDVEAQTWGVANLYSPMGDPELMSALTSFSPFHATSAVFNAGSAAATAESTQSTTFVNRLRDEYGIVVRNTAVPVAGSTASHHPLRISTHLWHSRGDVDRLVGAMADLTARMLAGK